MLFSDVTDLLSAKTVLSIHLHPTLFRTFVLMLHLDDYYVYSENFMKLCF